MELQRRYEINLICREKKSQGLFVAVELFNRNSSLYFQNYYNKLLLFNKCSDWFKSLYFPIVQIGEVVLLRISSVLWVRGVIVRLNYHDDFRPLIYLIDHQKFYNGSESEMRMCPPRFKELKLPTYYIDVDFSLNDFELNIEMLIGRHQYGELRFYFIPESVHNDVYVGELIVNNKLDNSFISLKKLLNNHTKSNIGDVQKYKQLTVYNPLKMKNLKQIFAPMNLCILDQSKMSSCSDLSDLNNSSEDLSNDSAVELLSSVNNSEDLCLSDDSALAFKKTRTNYKSPIAKQNVYSSSSSMSINNVCYKNKRSSLINSAKNDSASNSDQYVQQITEKLIDTAITSSFSESHNPIYTDSSLTQIKPNSVADNQIKKDNLEKKSFIDISMKKPFDCSSESYKILNSDNQQYSCSTVIKNGLKLPNVPNKSKVNLDVWWSSDSDS